MNMDKARAILECESYSKDDGELQEALEKGALAIEIAYRLFDILPSYSCGDADDAMEGIYRHARENGFDIEVAE